jgi:hypothetical protein
MKEFGMTVLAGIILILALLASVWGGTWLLYGFIMYLPWPPIL